ncbi:MAG: TIM barrel protein [Planctomycetes bacterium]|nr:TIM barrel protein [Planctomycetota bacterium]
MSSPSMPRRSFLGASVAALSAAAVSTNLAAEARADIPDPPGDRRIFKSLKYGMLKHDGSTTERFKLLKEVGFDAVELDTPGLNVADIIAARDASGLPVDGTVISTHWSVRHSDPVPDVRAKALEDLKQSIRETHAVGGGTVLLVVGHGKDGSPEEVWQRSSENIAKAIPLAAYYGVVIAFENVWNQFLYDHNGPANQTADKFKEYVDQFHNPWVGVHFDIGNHQKYCNPADWIRTLGKRIVKLDAKGFSRANNKFTKIGEGDIDWPDVRKALDEINYYGFCAAEVGGGERDRMTEIVSNLNKFVLGV